MAVYFAIGLFTLTVLIVTAALADSAVRFRNAWVIARRDLAATQADLSFELQAIGSNVVALRRPARSRPLGRPPQAASLSRARGLPTIAGAASAAA